MQRTRQQLAASFFKFCLAWACSSSRTCWCPFFSSLFYSSSAFFLHSWLGSRKPQQREKGRRRGLANPHQVADPMCWEAMGKKKQKPHGTSRQPLLGSVQVKVFPGNKEPIEADSSLRKGEYLWFKSHHHYSLHHPLSSNIFFFCPSGPSLKSLGVLSPLFFFFHTWNIQKMAVSLRKTFFVWLGYAASIKLRVLRRDWTTQRRKSIGSVTRKPSFRCLRSLSFSLLPPEIMNPVCHKNPSN